MKKILIIEDEPSLQKTLGVALRAEGYDVKQASDGEMGVLLTQKEKPDLILLDLVLPKKNGFEVLKEVKGDDSTRDIPVIVLTNLETVEDVGTALELGATTYLVKAHYEISDVMLKIKKVLSQ